MCCCIAHKDDIPVFADMLFKRTTSPIAVGVFSQSQLLNSSDFSILVLHSVPCVFLFGTGLCLTRAGRKDPAFHIEIENAMQEPCFQNDEAKNASPNKRRHTTPQQVLNL